RTSLDYQNLVNIHLGVVDQQFGVGTAYISLEDYNPVDNKNLNILDIPNNKYTAHPPTKVTPTRYQWLAAPNDLSKYPPVGFSGTRRVIGARKSIDLGTNATALFLPVYSGIVDIYCTMFDSTGQVAEARYRQVILTREEVDKVAKFQKYA